MRFAQYEGRRQAFDRSSPRRCRRLPGARHLPDVCDPARSVDHERGRGSRSSRLVGAGVLPRRVARLERTPVARSVIERPTASPLRSNFVTGRSAHRGTGPPSSQRFGVQHLAHLLGVVGPVGREPPLPPGPQPGRRERGEVRADQSPLVVPLLRPGVGEERPQLRERVGGHQVRAAPTPRRPSRTGRWSRRPPPPRPGRRRPPVATPRGRARRGRAAPRRAHRWPPPRPGRSPRSAAPRGRTSGTVRTPDRRPPRRGSPSPRRTPPRPRPATA